MHQTGWPKHPNTEDSGRGYIANEKRNVVGNSSGGVGHWSIDVRQVRFWRKFAGRNRNGDGFGPKTCARPAEPNHSGRTFRRAASTSDPESTRDSRLCRAEPSVSAATNTAPYSAFVTGNGPSGRNTC